VVKHFNKSIGDNNMEEIAKVMARSGGADGAIDTLYDLLDGFKDVEKIDKSDIRAIIDELNELV
jgi:hypothetical protein